jgi:hypothetical protein
VVGGVIRGGGGGGQDAWGVGGLIRHRNWLTLCESGFKFSDVRVYTVDKKSGRKGVRSDLIYHLTQYDRAHIYQAKGRRFKSRLREFSSGWHPTHLQSRALWVPRKKPRGRSKEGEESQEGHTNGSKLSPNQSDIFGR